MENTSDNPAIACTLNSEETRERRAWARRTVVSKITAYERISNGVVVMFEDSALARTQVEEFIILEKGCCGFLTFDLAPYPIAPGGVLRLTITGPEGAEKFLNTFVSAAQESPHVQSA